MASETRQSRFHRLLVEKPLLLLSVIFALGFAAVLWHATRLSTSLVESSALSNASRFSKVLAEFRSLYTSEVVDRVQGHAVEITHDYHDKAGAIPLPATLSMLLGEKIGTHGKGMEVHLYSPHPFPWRQNTGGLTDDFREEAWRHLSAKPGLPFFRFEEYRNRSALRYATADLMRTECVNCHNTHPDTPKNDWRKGELRGVLEVVVPLEAVREDSRSGLWGTIGLLIGMGLVTLACLALAIGQLKRGARGLEEEVADRTAELRQAVERADSANKAKSSFLANMSHEIRTPLNAIMGFAEILSGRIQDPHHKEHLDSIRASGKALVTLIDDILDLSKVETGTLVVKPKPTDVTEILRETQLVFSRKVQDKGLGFELEVDPGMPEVLVVDEGRTRQLLTNLIDNAVKFTHQGHVRVTAAGSPKAEDSKRVDLVFTVADTGIGIPDTQRDEIFGAFAQREGQSINEYGGVGRGLALVQALLRQMNGEISVKSQVGAGSTFTVTVRDVEVASEEQIEESKASEVDPESVLFGSGVVLVADDVSANRELVKGFLDGQPLSFVEAENGEEAIEAARLHQLALIFDGYQDARAGRFLRVQTFESRSSTEADSGDCVNWLGAPGERRRDPSGVRRIPAKTGVARSAV